MVASLSFGLKLRRKFLAAKEGSSEEKVEECLPLQAKALFAFSSEDLCLTLLPLEVSRMRFLGKGEGPVSVLHRPFLGFGFLLWAVHSYVTCNSAMLHEHLYREGTNAFPLPQAGTTERCLKMIFQVIQFSLEHLSVVLNLAVNPMYSPL